MIKTNNYEIETKGCLNNITSLVKQAIKDTEIKNGTVIIETVTPTTGILLINSKGEEVLSDIELEMRRLIPARINYKYQESPEAAAGHIKSSLFGCSVSLIIKDAKLICDGKQDIYFADYDCPNNREVSICVMGE